jgi:predicted Zn-dependent peptidase
MKRLILVAALVAACSHNKNGTTTPPGSMPTSSMAQLPPPKPADTGPVFPDEAFRAKQPTPGPEHSFKPPTIVTFPLKNGIDVYLVEDHSLPVVSMQLVLDGGAATDPDGAEGTTGLCTELLGQGTDKLDKSAFEAAQADIASSVNTGATTDQETITMSTLTKHLDATLDLWTGVILHPGLRQADFDRLLKTRVAGLTAMKGDPRGLAGRLFRSVVYGPKHPYGRFATEGSYKKVTLASCQKFVKDAIAPQGAKLFVMGDVSRADVENNVGKRLAGWTGKPKLGAAAAKSASRDGKVFFVDVPNAVQSVLMFVEEAPGRTAPDYFATDLAGSVFGGDFSSRLNMEIREKKGYAYGAFGGFRYSRAGGLLVAQASVRADATKDAIADMWSMLGGMNDVSDDEVSENKNGEVLAMPATFATPADALSQFSQLVYYGLPLDYYERFVASVNAVTKADILKAAKDHFLLDKMQLLVVGDAKTQLAGVQALVDAGTFGPKTTLVVLDPDGNVVKK